jgi:nicotinate dehydrogenase subunit B
MTAGQITELVSYLRQQFAPDKQPWTDVAAAVDLATAANVR